MVLFVTHFLEVVNTQGGHRRAMAAAVAAVSPAAPGECLHPPHALTRKYRNAAAKWGSTYWSEAAISVRSRSGLVIAM